MNNLNLNNSRDKIPYRERLRDIKSGKIKEELTKSDYSLIFDHLIFDLYEIKSVLDLYAESNKTIDDMEKTLEEIREITHR